MEPEPLAAEGSWRSRALDARFRVLPKLRDDNVQAMLPHIVAVTILGILFVVAGVGIRTGGWF